MKPLGMSRYNVTMSLLQCRRKELEHKLALKTDEQKEEARILKEREDMFLRVSN